MTAIPRNPFNLDIANWELLERAIAAAGLPPDTANEFMWMGEWRQGEHQYKHRDTRGYATLTADMDPQMAVARVTFARDDGRWGGVA